MGMDELIQKLEILATEYARNSQMATAGDGDDSFSAGYWAGKLGGISDAIMYAKLIQNVVRISKYCTIGDHAGCSRFIEQLEHKGVKATGACKCECHK